MKILVVFAFASVTLVQAQLDGPKLPLVPTPPIPPIPTPTTNNTDTNTESDLCFLKSCGPKGQFFTDVCQNICTASSFAGGTCTYVKDADGGRRAQCACSGSIGDAKILLTAACGLFCPSSCFACSLPDAKFATGVCTRATDDSIGCTCKILS